MMISDHKTKIVCTIGPSTRSLPMIEAMIKAGMNVARLNFSHGDFAEHKIDIHNIRKASDNLKQLVGILIDLPGVKMRIGVLKDGMLILKNGELVTLTTKNVLGTSSLIPVSYKSLPKSVSKGSIVFLNDGFIQLRVESVVGTEIHCRVMIGGKILSHKGLNLPGAKLFLDPITKRDLEIIDFGLSHGVTTFGLSFVEGAKDILKVREFARSKGKKVYLVSKIERSGAIENFDEILKVTDAVMVARGDLGIETPIEQVPVVQKELIRKANIFGRPVITATQMLGSMTQNIRPTRAEVNDVANAILDGTDAIMLSEETAIGDYPVETIKMMVKIACSTENLYHTGRLSAYIRQQVRNKGDNGSLTIPDTISLNVVDVVRKLNVRYILTQASSGSTARHLSRLKPSCWILAFSPIREVCEFLLFSYGVFPFLKRVGVKNHPDVLLKNIKSLRLGTKGDTVIIAERRFSPYSGETDSLSIVNLQ